MHPDARYRPLGPVAAAARALVASEGWGMVVATAEGGMRVQHVPLVMRADGAILFHLANAGPLVPTIGGARALVIVNGPHGYVSPHWYPADARAKAVPTWDYIALEAEGPVETLDDDALRGLLAAIARQEEERLAPKPEWSADECDADHHARLMRGITGYALVPERLAMTEKLHQSKDARLRAGVADALAALGNTPLAARLRDQAA